MPLLLILWRLAAGLAGPFPGWRIARRDRVAGISALRRAERRGFASRGRPPGPVLWLHAASLGEGLSILPLIAALRAARPDLSCLVTTLTPTSATILEGRLPEGAFHQFAPLDTPAALRRFLRHWRPALLIVVENDLWPVMLDSADRAGLPRARINARLSPRARRRLRRMPAIMRALVAPFRLATAQDAETATALRALGCPEVRVTGDMKAAAAPPPADAALLARLRGQIGTRPVWAAVSTHPGEEEVILAAHEEVRRALPDALLILCPRHPERGAAIAALAPMTRRALGEGPEGAVWLVDTLGETGLWYRLAPVTFMGGSLVPVGGHNPWEGAQCGTALLHGPQVANAALAWEALDAAGAARLTRRESLGATVAGLLADPA
ncbi:MAG: hypothetical protein IT542_08005, partial [Rubellimicrobium sp.]|nr:hypothetical protein [Rubellimicrobium sp.]